MQITKKNEISLFSFDSYDMPYLAKNGIINTMQAVHDFYSIHKMYFPFLSDIHQLAGIFPMNAKRLFDLAKDVDDHYREIELKKKSGEIRRIYAPDKELKWRQKTIRRKILMKFSPSKYAKAYVRQRTLVDNASPHVGKHYLLKLDISDFFGSIRFEQVYAAAFHTNHFPKQIGVLLTALCCYKGALPQGAPTSPALSNLVMRNFDNNIGQWCESRGISYTRYSDDMTFSSNEPLYPVYQKVKAMLQESGFRLNEKKTHFVTNASRQSVTGLTVNEKVAVSREYKRRVRQEVYYALKFREADDTERQRIIGRINYILQIEPGNTQFQTALEQMRKL